MLIQKQLNIVPVNAFTILKIPESKKHAPVVEKYSCSRIALKIGNIALLNVIGLPENLIELKKFVRFVERYFSLCPAEKPRSLVELYAKESPENNLNLKAFAPHVGMNLIHEIDLEEKHNQNKFIVLKNAAVHKL